MNTTPSPAETLRRAAALMRERAEDATPHEWVSKRGPGEHVYGGEFGNTWVADAATREDRRHIASWHPSVALAVADWLETVAPHVEDGWPEAKALAVALAYLGGDE